jgi:hypothetical protein
MVMDIIILFLFFKHFIILQDIQTAWKNLAKVEDLTQIHFIYFIYFYLSLITFSFLICPLT